MLYFTIDLFVDALILVLHFNNGEVQNLLRQLLDIYEKETKESTYMENEFFAFYIHLIKEVITMNLDPNNRNDIESFLLKFKSNPMVMKDPELYTTLKTVFTDRSDLSKDKYEYLTRKLSNAVLWYNNTKAVKKMFGKLSTGSISSSPDKQQLLLNEMSTLCADIIRMNQDSMNAIEGKNENQARIVDFSSKASINKALNVYNKTSVSNVFKTGLQGMNRAFGKNRGFRLGESIVFNSLSFNGKSLTLLKFARWAVTLNKVSEDFKNPTCLLYSLENETPHNTMQLFRETYINLFQQVPPSEMTEEQIIEFCHAEFTKLGWKFVVDRRLGAEFGFAELVANFEEYKRAGFTPLVCIIDYMNMLKKGGNGDDGGSNHLLLRDVYTNTCNYLKSQNCTMVTAHQLNRKAAEAVRQNPMGAVKRFGIDMLSDGMDPQREIDVSFYQHKEIDPAGRAFMTWKMDKHRYDTDTPDTDKYFAYMFEGELGILDDINGEDKSVKNIYACKFDDGDDSPSGGKSGVVATSGGLNLFG